MLANVPLPPGYRFEQLKRSEISPLITSLTDWYPDITVGSASCYLREEFYTRAVSLAGEPEMDVMVILAKSDRELAAMYSCERDRDTLAPYARLAAVAPRHRGAHLGPTGLVLAEFVGRAMGMGIVYGLATLKHPYMQRVLEELGFQHIGITPGYDRDMVAPGVVAHFPIPWRCRPCG